MIDLHCHTTASDGIHPPAEVVRRAAAAGVKILAISDHDTVEGVAEAAAEAMLRGIRIIPAVEISARFGEDEVHLLGHFVDPDHLALREGLASFRGGRLRRAERMVEKLRQAGVDLHMDELLAEVGASGGAVGRPHFARLLIAKGHAADFQEAFDRWLGKGKIGFVERELPTAKEALRLIRRAGGASSLAHPALSGVDGAGMMELAAQGLEAIEVGHPGQGSETRRRLRAIADSLGLLTTAGSDFHGDSGALGAETMDSAAFLAYEALAKAVD